MDFTNLTITLHSTDSSFYHTMSKTEAYVFLNSNSFDEFQDKLIKIVTGKKMHASIRNSRNNEIFEMRFSPKCPEGICCTWQSNARLNRFIKQFGE